jgi:hypothetical protein
MAKRTTPFLLEEPLDQAFERVLGAVGEQGWQVRKAKLPAPFTWLVPELNIEAGTKQRDGCGRTRIQFSRSGSNRTRIKIYTRWALTENHAETPAISLLSGLSLGPKEHHLDPASVPFPGRNERKLIRVFVGAVIVITIAAAVLVPVPKDSEGNQDPPAVALKDKNVFRAEVALLVFYGGLLLLTPAFAGVFRGRLPTEISTKGARYEEDVKQERAETSDGVANELGKEIFDLKSELGSALGNIETLALATKTSLGQIPGQEQKT